MWLELRDVALLAHGLAPGADDARRLHTRNHISKKPLQVRGGVHKNGAIIEGGTCLGNWEQQWFLEPAR